jgi:hypothetical protein
MTLGNAAAARARLIVRCRDRAHCSEPDPAGLGERHGARTGPCRTGRRGLSACGAGCSGST